MRWGTKKVRNFKANTFKIKQKRILGIICLKKQQNIHTQNKNKQTNETPWGSCAQLF